jgi:hypothetical protein
MLVRQEPLPTGLLDDVLEEGARDVARQQPLAILFEGRRRPHRVIHPETSSPDGCPPQVDGLGRRV